MLEKIKGFRTYATLFVIGILGLLVQVQQSCLTDASLADVCSHIPMKQLGIGVTVLSGVAAWFRKLANK